MRTCTKMSMWAAAALLAVGTPSTPTVGANDGAHPEMMDLAVDNLVQMLGCEDRDDCHDMARHLIQEGDHPFVKDLLG